MYPYVCVCIYMYMYIYIYIHTYTYNICVTLLTCATSVGEQERRAASEVLGGHASLCQPAQPTGAPTIM